MITENVLEEMKSVSPENMLAKSLLETYIEETEDQSVGDTEKDTERDRKLKLAKVRLMRLKS